MPHLSKHERKRKEEGDNTKTTAVSGRKNVTCKQSQTLRKTVQ